jgi:hypothetical protein
VGWAWPGAPLGLSSWVKLEVPLRRFSLPPSITQLSLADTEDTCPYAHIRGHPSTVNTTPTYNNVSSDTPLPHCPDDAAYHTMLHRRQHTSRTKLVTAIADFGASHVLLRVSDAHVLGDVVYTLPHETPYAVWKAGNGSNMAAIGRGVLRVGTFNLPAFVFQDKDLASNLLGVAPFSNHDCTATFTPTTFRISERTGSPILTGERELGSSLWVVRLEGVAKPTLSATTRTAPSAFAVTPQTDARFVQFVHAAMGYSASTTFLHAVTARYITGPSQYPRLTPKMVRRHLPQAMATARGHLDKTPAAQPHAHSKAVSARKRHHHRKTTLIPNNKMPPFDHTSVPKSTTLHMDYTEDLPETCLSGTRCFMVSCWESYIHLEPLVNLRSA